MAIWNERIRSKRLEKGITLAQVADTLGVTEATAQRYESGSIKSVPYEYMCAYGKLFNCSPAYLMGWEPEIDYIVKTDSDQKNDIETYQKCSSHSKEKRLESRLLAYFNSLSDLGKKKALDNIEDLAKIYSAKDIIPNAANKRTDIEVPEDTDTSDDDIMDDENF